MQTKRTGKKPRLMVCVVFSTGSSLSHCCPPHSASSSSSLSSCSYLSSITWTPTASGPLPSSTVSLRPWLLHRSVRKAEKTPLTPCATFKAACLCLFSCCRHTGERHVAGVSAFSPYKDDFSQSPYTGLCDGHAEHRSAADVGSPTGFPLLPL